MSATIRIGAASLMLLTVLVVSAATLRDPVTIDAISFTNEIAYDIHVELSDGDATDWMPVGVAVQHCTTTFHLVIDQGRLWTVRFRSQGVDGGQTQINRVISSRRPGRWPSPTTSRDNSTTAEQPHRRNKVASGCDGQ